MNYDILFTFLSDNVNYKIAFTIMSSGKQEDNNGMQNTTLLAPLYY